MDNNLTNPDWPTTPVDQSPREFQDDKNGNSSQEKELTKPNRQRFKPQLSCTFCRNRKMKCDRGSPCSNCAKRNLSSSCTYIHASSREKVARVQKPQTKPTNVQERIQHLEKLVVTLMTKSQSNEPTLPSRPNCVQPSFNTLQHGTFGPAISPDSDTRIPETPESIGYVSVDDEHEQQYYIGGGHWAAILENIAGLKDSVASHEWPRGMATTSTTDTTKENYVGPELLLGENRRASRESILACLPAKSTMDGLLNNFYMSSDIVHILLHKPTFQREYGEFWDDPKSKSVAWVGLLFSILCLATNFENLAVGKTPAYTHDSAFREPADRIKLYREKTVQCLVLSNYTEPSSYTVETLICYYISEHFESKDTLFGSWMVFGIIVRAAMRMGLHRDPSHFTNISVFRGEMQRRLWFAIMHLDTLGSYQVGLPRMLKQGTSDTKLPKLLSDEDLFENMEVLPPERSGTTSQPLGHALAKSRIASMFELIVDAENSITPMAYADCLKYDQMLAEAYQLIPECYKAKSVTDLTGPMPSQIRQSSIELFYLKSRLFLHRRFLLQKESLDKYPSSVKVCVDASMETLKFHNFMENMAGNGTPFGNRWINSSLMTHDFLLAATLLCVYLGRLIEKKSIAEEAVQSGFPTGWSIDDVSQTLLLSYKRCTDSARSSHEMNKFARILRTMLQKAGKWPSTMEAEESSEGTIGDQNMANSNNRATSTGRIAPPTHLDPSPNASSPFNLDIMEDLVNDNTAFDWNIWDSNFQGNIMVDVGSGLWADMEAIPFQNNMAQNNTGWGGV